VRKIRRSKIVYVPSHLAGAVAYHHYRAIGHAERGLQRIVQYRAMARHLGQALVGAAGVAAGPSAFARA
jgi:hypothetical protein